MDQILANLADAVPDTFTDVSGEEAELPGEINDVMQVRCQSCVNKHMSHPKKDFYGRVYYRNSVSFHGGLKEKTGLLIVTE